MKPINYDEIFEKAEARRAALEAITPKLQAIYDLWDTLYAAARPINSVNADFEQLDSEAAALLAQSVGVSVSTLGCGLHYLANVMQMLDRPSKDLLEALKPNEEARHLTPLSEQAAPKAAPGEPTDSDGFGSAEHWKEKAQYWAGVAHRLRGEALRGEPVDGIVQPPAPQQEVQEPALFVSSKQLAALTDPDDPEGEHGRYLPARKTSQGLFTQPLYTAPQPAPAPLSDDTKRLDWLDRNIFSREMSEWDAKYGHGPDYNMWVVFSPKGVQGSARNIIDAALAAQGGKDA